MFSTHSAVERTLESGTSTSETQLAVRYIFAVGRETRARVITSEREQFAFGEVPFQTSLSQRTIAVARPYISGESPGRLRGEKVDNEAGWRTPTVASRWFTR